jgi:enoyl-CoA hydratase/carnithine racemase
LHQFNHIGDHTMSDLPLISQRNGHVATITLNRPDKLNVWSPAMELELRRLMLEFGSDDDVRVIVLTGAGRAFCAGVDVEALKGAADGDASVARAPGKSDHQSTDADGDFNQRYSYLLSIPKPVICALNGAAAGVGIVLSLYSDIRYASSSAKFAAVFARRGLVAEHGIGWLLPRLIGLPRAMEWLLSARTMSAEEALRIGLVADVFDEATFHQNVEERAQMLAQSVSPRSARIIKRQLYEACFQTLAEATRVAEFEVQQCLKSDDFREGVAHFLEKRAPRFTGR